MTILRVLIVEDDPAYARFLGETLRESAGVDLRSERAGTLEEAITKLQDAPFDVALVDLGLPDADGTEVVTRIAELVPHTPIVVLSGLKDVNVALESMRIGAQEYLVKGEAEHALLPRVIHYAIERKRLQSAAPMLLGIVGHDLRTPLNTISLGAALLVNDASLGPDQRRRVQQIERAASRAASLVNDLLDLTRVRVFGQMIPVKREEVDLLPLLQQLVAELTLAHPQTRITLGARGHTDGELDGARVAQAVSNLVRNSVEHGATGGGVDLKVTGDDDAIVIDVHNEGERLSPERLRILFEPLEDRAKDVRTGGLGLGLYIVQAIARAHDGDLQARSDDTGTTFSLSLRRHARL